MSRATLSGSTPTCAISAATRSDTRAVTKSDMSPKALPICLVLAALAPPSLARERIEIRPASDVVESARYGIPIEFRVSANAKEAVVVTSKSGPRIALLGLETGSMSQIPIGLPEGISQFTPAGADFAGEKEIAVAASWVESQTSRSGIAIIDREGKILAIQGYGISVRSIAASRGRDILAASIQEPQDPLAETPNRPSGNLVALFDLRAKLIARHQTGCSPVNAFKTFEDMVKTHPRRKVNLLRDDVVLSMPGASRWSYPAACVLSSENLRGSRENPGTAAKVAPSGLVSFVPLFKPPVLEGVPDWRSLRALNVLPFSRGTVPMYLVVWFAGGEETARRDVPEGGPYRDAGRIIFAGYGASVRPTDAPEWVAEVEGGTRIAEVSATPDGRIFALTYSKISEGWRVSEITVKHD